MTAAFAGATTLPLRAAGKSLTPAQREVIGRAFRSNAELQAWSDDVLQHLCEAGQLHTYDDGQLVYAQGDVCSDIQVILTGALEMGWSSQAGVRAVGSFVSPGDVINFISVIDGQTSMHEQRAHGQTKLFHIPVQALFQAFERDPALVRSVLDLICRRARLLHNRLGKTVLLTFRARLADQLLTLAANYGEPDDMGIRLRIKISQEDMAALLGAARQSVNKELRWLVDQNILHQRYSRFTILNLEALLAISRNE